jgi:hypothetical protein
MFVIDTSSIIHGWRRDYPPDTFPSLWQRIERLAQQGILIAPNEVLLELERGGDEIYEWARDQGSLFVEPDGEVQEKVTEIVDRWPAFVPDDSHDGVWADPYVVALAGVRSATVVTGEAIAPPGARRPKIPNICQALGIPCSSLVGLLRSRGWIF